MDLLVHIACQQQNVLLKQGKGSQPQPHWRSADARRV
jgi:hypothetical protein